MKKAGIMIALILIISVLASCDKPAYQYVNGDGNDYAVIHMEEEQSLMDGCGPEPYVNFASVEEMIQDITTGNFTEEELGWLNKMTKDEQGRVKLPDLDNLYFPVFPQGAVLEKVTIHGCRYVYDFGGFWVSQWAETAFSGSTFSHFYSEDIPVLTPDDPDEERFAFEFDVIEGENYKKRYYLYILQGDYGPVCVEEMYNLPYTEGDSPYRIKLHFPSINGRYWKVYIKSYFPPEGVTLEWLASFGVEPYEG